MHVIKAVSDVGANKLGLTVAEKARRLKYVDANIEACRRNGNMPATEKSWCDLRRTIEDAETTDGTD
jgi:hypothetical protein